VERHLARRAYRPSKLHHFGAAWITSPARSLPLKSKWSADATGTMGADGVVLMAAGADAWSAAEPTRPKQSLLNSGGELPPAAGHIFIRT
jgi:hypothetical protein